MVDWPSDISIFLPAEGADKHRWSTTNVRQIDVRREETTGQYTRPSALQRVSGVTVTKDEVLFDWGDFKVRAPLGVGCSIAYK